MQIYTITQDDIAAANTYVPTAEKMAYIRYVAEKCFDKLDITTNTDPNAETRPLPSRYKLNTDRKARYLMGAFVGMYLQKEFERETEDDEWLMSVGDYDMYAGGHVFDSLNRMKNNAAVRDKLYDLLADYSELKYRLESDIKGLLDAMNDSVSRALAYIELSASPVELEKAMKEMTENKELLDSYLANRDENLKEVMEANDGNEDEEF